MMISSKVLIVLSICSFILYPSTKASANEAYRFIQIIQNGGYGNYASQQAQVEIGFGMVNCYWNRRCPRVTMKMTPGANNLLGQPKKMTWNYTVSNVPSDCTIYPGAIYYYCRSHESRKKSSTVEVVYNGGNDSFWTMQTGGAFEPGIGYNLTSVCFLDGIYGKQCQNVSLEGRSYRVAFEYKTVYFNAPGG